MPRLLAVLLSSCCVASCRSAEEPHPPGAAEIRAGFALYEQNRCAACHGGPAPAGAAPRLDRVGALRPPRAIEELLEEHEPALLDGFAQRDRPGALAELAHFLVRLGGPAPELEATSVDAGALERGRQLYHSIGCVACHAPYEEAANLARPLWEFADAFETRPASEHGERARDPDALPDVTGRWTLATLASYLVDPLQLHPDGRMPSMALSGSEASDLAAYLWFEARVDAGAHLALAPGLTFEYFEGSFPDDTVPFDALEPLRRSVATSFFDGIERREDDFAFRFRGLVEIATAGEHVFSTTSDDGSELWIDGRLVVDNRGQHSLDERSGAVHLEKGRHAIEITYFEHMGGDGLAMHWQGPGFAKRELAFDVLSHVTADVGAEREAFDVDGALAERGRERAAELGCAACHALDPARSEAARPLAELRADRGCLDSRSKTAHPRFALSDAERTSLAAAVRSRTLPAAPSAGERLAAELARLDCGACHERGDGLAGPGDERRSYFQVERGLDLGDEGRLPPSLDRAGAKLRPEWMASVLAGEGRARSYMKTRMPRFGAHNVEQLPVLFAEVDAAQRDEREPAFSVDAVAAGRDLAGTNGLGCIQCHELAGHPSIGIPAVDLAHVTERIYPGWFRELLMDPVALKMNTRMPAFWVDGKSPVKTLYGGDPAAQVDALWTYLSLGSSMPLPKGLVPLPGEYEVEVTDTPVCVGVFMEGVGPRTVCVGLPERVHYAFDVEHSRLALAWRGRFLDARGTWHGRAGQLEKPAGEDVLEFPPGPFVALLGGADDPWPTTLDADARYRALGRTVDDARRPTFRYQLGDVIVTDTVVPDVRSGGAALRRMLKLLSPSFAEVDLRLAVGDVVQEEADGGWTIRGDTDLRVRIAPPAWRDKARIVRDSDGKAELRVRYKVGIYFALANTSWENAHSSEIAVEYSW